MTLKKWTAGIAALAMMAGAMSVLTTSAQARWAVHKPNGDQLWALSLAAFAGAFVMLSRNNNEDTPVSP